MTRLGRNEAGADLQQHEDADEASHKNELGRYDEDDVTTLPWLPLVDRSLQN